MLISYFESISDVNLILNIDSIYESLFKLEPSDRESGVAIGVLLKGRRRHVMGWMTGREVLRIALISTVAAIHRRGWKRLLLLLGNLELYDKLGLQVYIPRHNYFGSLSKDRKWVWTNEEIVCQVNLVSGASL